MFSLAVEFVLSCEGLPQDLDLVAVLIGASLVLSAGVGNSLIVQTVEVWSLEQKRKSSSNDTDDQGKRHDGDEELELKVVGVADELQKRVHFEFLVAFEESCWTVGQFLLRIPFVFQL